MPRSFFRSLLVLTSVLISACSPLITRTPPPLPQLLQIAYSPTLRPIVERLHQCALEHPEISLVTQETSMTGSEITKADLTLWFGEPPQDIAGYPFSVGMDEIVVIGGEKVSLQNLNKEKLLDLYTSSNSAYQIWTYSADNELRAIFDKAVLGDAPISPEALLAPHPAAMLEAMALNPMALGYLPSSWLIEDIRTSSVEPDLQKEFEHPILALTQNEPEGNLRAYLICLQNATR